MTKEYWEMLASEIPNTLREQIAGVLHKYSTGLIKLYLDHWDEKEIMLIGAGTFVSIGKLHGILTAQHVAKELSLRDGLGFTLQAQEHNFHIPVQHLTIMDVAVPEEEDFGPDLSYIVIPDTYLGMIEAHRTFYDLSIEREERFNITFDKRDLCFVCGTIGKRTTEEKPNKGFEKVIGVHGYCGESFVEKLFDTGDYDYIEIKVDYDSGDDIPSSFGGMSGGGIWLVPLQKDKNGKIRVKDYKYRGLIFYQTERKENTRFIRGHGPKSLNIVYDSVISQMS